MMTAMTGQRPADVDRHAAQRGDLQARARLARADGRLGRGPCRRAYVRRPRGGCRGRRRCGRAVLWRRRYAPAYSACHGCSAVPEPGVRLHAVPAALPLPGHRPAAPSRPARRPPAARSSTRCWSGSSTCLPPSARSTRRRAGRAGVGRAARGRARARPRWSTTTTPRRWPCWVKDAEATTLVERWFTLEDPTRLEPAERELYVEADLDGLILRGYVDRLDVAPDGARSGWSTTRPGARRPSCSRARRCSR